MTPDALVKALEGYLYHDFPAELLRALGWQDFRRFDYRGIEDPVVMAGRVLVSVFGSAGLEHRRCALACIAAFVTEQLKGTYPSSKEMRSGIKLMEQEALDEPAVCRWFRENC